MAKTNYLADAIVKHIYGGTALAQPSTWWMAVYNSDPGKSVTPTTPPQLATARAQINGWTIGANGQTQNTNTITFAPVPVGQTWPNVSHFVIFDAQTGGNPLIVGAFSSSRSLQAGDVFAVAAGRLIITES